ncbi:FtsH protease activity modulator HflK [Marinimicrobium sp. ABcell2]|uniref:FtsH protease activity modulator HflK n=1 Tax=Marinimicrobium sp. ABcell2 TaxID=3069751 RepID=UPI0027AEAAF1|nr:FtsH protease activity modulator HflK [Marinimicrobium sp. ABcell2]MDQ2076366.1 FtsH protease activity modulator HflK [Marinimicrobium sp. ABcell2]
MAWNQPGGGGKDPWGGGGGSGGPPDLDEAWKKLRDRLNGMFGGGSGGGDAGGGNSGGSASLIPLIAVGVLVLAIVYLLSGFYVVNAQERAVVLRLGAFHEIKDEGLRWNARLINEVFVENVTQERQYASRALMLTQDESIVELPITVQYNVADVRSYVLSVRDPEVSLRHAADSALRHVIGSTELNQALSGGREAIGREVHKRLQLYLDNYGTGIAVRQVNLQEGRPPQEVREAFDDVIKAREEEERIKNEAQAYANSVIPEARGRAQRMIEEAEAYRAEVVARAEGESRRFELLLAEYQRAPEVTRERLYIETLQGVMEASSKVMLDVADGNNVLFLPLDRMGSAAGQKTSAPRTDASADAIRQVTEQVSRELGSRNTTRPVRREVR